jgi:hypothetical protein
MTRRFWAQVYYMSADGKYSSKILRAAAENAHAQYRAQKSLLITVPVGELFFGLCM